MTGAVNLFGLTQAQFETFVLVLVRGRDDPVHDADLSVGPGATRASASGWAWRSRSSSGASSRRSPRSMGSGGLTAAVFAQSFIGFVFGFVAFLVFVGIQFAGEVMDLQVGFSIVNVINPLTSQNVSVLGEFELALGSLIYPDRQRPPLLLRGHGRLVQPAAAAVRHDPGVPRTDVMGVLRPGAFSWSSRSPRRSGSRCSWSTSG